MLEAGMIDSVAVVNVAEQKAYLRYHGLLLHLQLQRVLERLLCRAEVGYLLLLKHVLLQLLVIEERLHVSASDSGIRRNRAVVSAQLLCDGQRRDRCSLLRFLSLHGGWCGLVVEAQIAPPLLLAVVG